MRVACHERILISIVHGPPKANEVYQSRHLIKKLTLDMNPEIPYPGTHLYRIKDMWTDSDFKHLSKLARKRGIHEVR